MVLTCVKMGDMIRFLKANVKATRYSMDLRFGKKFYNKDRRPVTTSNEVFDAGPIPNTVAVPAIICVFPASCIISAIKPKLVALAYKRCKSSSEVVLRAIFGCPLFSQAFTAFTD